MSNVVDREANAVNAVDEVEMVISAIKALSKGSATRDKIAHHCNLPQEEVDTVLEILQTENNPLFHTVDSGNEEFYYYDPDDSESDEESDEAVLAVYTPPAHDRSVDVGEFHVKWNEPEGGRNTAVAKFSYGDSPNKVFHRVNFNFTEGPKGDRIRKFTGYRWIAGPLDITREEVYRLVDAIYCQEMIVQGRMDPYEHVNEPTDEYDHGDNTDSEDYTDQGDVTAHPQRFGNYGNNGKSARNFECIQDSISKLEESTGANLTSAVAISNVIGSNIRFGMLLYLYYNKLGRSVELYSFVKSRYHRSQMHLLKLMEVGMVDTVYVRGGDRQYKLTESGRVLMDVILSMNTEEVTG